MPQYANDPWLTGGAKKKKSRKSRKARCRKGASKGVNGCPRSKSGRFMSRGSARARLSRKKSGRKSLRGGRRSKRKSKKSKRSRR